MVPLIELVDVSRGSAAALQRSARIDVLRGLSILLVILHHMGLRLPLKGSALADFLPRRLISALNWNGYEAVFVFFVISGFLITSHSLLRWGSLARIDVRAFYVRRCARILPCLLALVSVLVALHEVGAMDYVVGASNQTLAGALVAVFGLHLNLYEGLTGYLPGSWDVLWSLSIEEAFYLGFPLLCMVFRSERALLATLFMLALSLPITRAALSENEIWQEKAYLPGMAAIATGVIVALIAKRWSGRSVTIARMLTVIGAAGLASVLLTEREWWALLGNGTMLVLTGSVACLLLAIDARSAPCSRHFFAATTWLRSFGRLSYEIYLGHMFVIFTLVSLHRRLGIAPYWSFLVYVPCVLASWAIGALASRWISKPCGNWLMNRTIASPVSVHGH